LILLMKLFSEIFKSKGGHVLLWGQMSSFRASC
jgi:hypothetical protein